MTREKPSIGNLIAKARQDESHLNELFGWYRPYLRIKALGDQRIQQLGTKLDGSDIAQDVLRRAHKSFEQFEGTEEPQLTTWLQTILNNTIADAARSFYGPTRDITRERSLNLASESATLNYQGPVSEGSTAGSHYLKGEAALELAAAIESLPENQSEAVRLKHLEMLKLEQIAKQMGKSESAIAGLLQRGTSTLRKLLRDKSS